MLHMDEKQLKAINSKASKKKFADHVLNNNVDKVNKMCAKGIDPNFHCQDSHIGGKNFTLCPLWSVVPLCSIWSLKEIETCRFETMLPKILWV